MLYLQYQLCAQKDWFVSAYAEEFYHLNTKNNLNKKNIK